MVIHQGPKEEFCRLATVLGTKEFVVASLTQEFRDERIGVVGTQVGVASLQWVYLLVMIERASLQVSTSSKPSLASYSPGNEKKGDAIGSSEKVDTGHGCRWQGHQHSARMP